MKAHLKEKVWFPAIDTRVEDMVASCIMCQATGPHVRLERIISSATSDVPWGSVSADFCVMSPGSYLLVLVDDYSKSPEVEFVSPTSAEVVLPKVAKVFTTHGLPASLRTVNGPAFQGTVFRQYLDRLGIAHRKITPY